MPASCLGVPRCAGAKARRWRDARTAARTSIASINTGRGGWRQARYGFANRSTDITSIFCSACDVADLHWTAAFPSDERRTVTIYVSRKADVARLDTFIGPMA
jgi:predicted secreted protein